MSKNKIPLDAPIAPPSGKSNGGRTKLDLNDDVIYKLAKLHCTNEEIAFVMECSKDTIERRFAATLAKGRNDGKARLRRLQWRAAERGSYAMMIWLGKQYLGQSEKIEATNTNTNQDHVITETEAQRVKRIKEKLKRFKNLEDE